MTPGNGNHQYNTQLYTENGVQEQDVYMDSEEYGEEFDEEFVQLDDGSLIPSTSEGANGSQSSNFSVIGSYVQQQRPGQQNILNEIRKPQQMYCVKAEDGSSTYDYVKSATPTSREDKSISVTGRTSYHVVSHQPSASYTYNQLSSTPISASYRQPYTYSSQKPFENKSVVKHNKRKSLIGQRKPCNCTKSMCLKLYCDCFANGEFCRDCNCKDCHNNMDFEADRTRAIKQSLERNPNAFKPKIGVSKGGSNQTDIERLHQKGCHCKKSGCLKNYCECYEAKVPCTDRCKCKGCQNTEADRAVRFKDKLPGTSLLGTLAGNMLPGTSTTAKVRNRNDSDSASDNEIDLSDPRGYPWFYMTDDVIDAATMCMVAQAEEALGKKDKPNTEELERLVLREFGRCLEQIITSTGSPAAV